MIRDRVIQLVAAIVAIAAFAGAGTLLPVAVKRSEEAGLRYTDVAVEGAPPIVAIGTAIGALRGIIVDYLWIRLTMMKEQGLFYEIMANVYGLSNAPRAWTGRARKELLARGFVPHTGDHISSAVVTTSTCAAGSSCASDSETSPVPGGRSTSSTSGSSQNTSVTNDVSALCSIGPRQMTA